MKYKVIIFIVLFILILYFIYISYNNIYEGLDTNIKGNTTIPQHADEKDPFIKPVTMSNILNDEECNNVIDYAVEFIAEQNVIEGRYVYTRNKQHVFAKKNDPYIKPILEKIATKFNQPFENMENPLIVRYLPYQTYIEHNDSCCDQNDKCRDFIKRGGQRVLTVLIYLSDNFTGGGTYFKKLNLNLKPKKGGAVVFHSLAQNSDKCHLNAVHQEQPLEDGIKWAMHVWFRENTFK
ncbi:prolyl 4-hydroxylase alpha subunit [Fadolivirus algeromassiliense]|jgi:prolyl 4-hydroxylase|uniref:Prolyl 4-hydroxylase alpha subunit n=1 Tax=Fadolivirus FV1/VV64 TaxID=3070911 RepID=A0A7D3QWJ5_9VIRU|nr:prolyl 4-hydroxylase alpha subunit [Fadolivirus algeromassiliense]QKF94666.1 prolyl 4-hydroxylase alpha subunit [Fadolivirus FV1/VV64]